MAYLAYCASPLRYITLTMPFLHRLLFQVKTIAEELGVGFLGVGFDPKHSIDQIPMMPKGR